MSPNNLDKQELNHVYLTIKSRILDLGRNKYRLFLHRRPLNKRLYDYRHINPLAFKQKKEKKELINE